jgi:hypothetical protein
MRKVHNDQFQDSTVINYKSPDDKILSTQGTDSSKRNLALIKKLRTLEIVSI